jgi:hypothetical protein
MPRFYFHLVSPGSYATDEVGGEFADFEAAYLDAHHAALEIAFEMLREHQDPGKLQFEIVDDQGRFLVDLPFSEVMRPGGRAVATNVVRQSIKRNLSRNRELQAEIKTEFAQTRIVLADARATMKRSRVRA